VTRPLWIRGSVPDSRYPHRASSCSDSWSGPLQHSADQQLATVPEPRGILVEGSGAHSIVFVHGWPDTARLWDRQVEALRVDYRCVRLTLPGFDRPSRRAFSHDAVVEHIRDVIERECPGESVTLMVHDWGCVFGYAVAARFPHLVDRIIAVDVGDAGSRRHRRELGFSGKLAIAAYQWWLAIAWVIGGPLGNAMSRIFARVVRAPAPARDIHWGMAYPYAIRWLRVAGGPPPRVESPRQPMLYIYGARKPVMFHSRDWLRQKAEEPGSAVVGMPAGHWMMVTRAAAFNDVVIDWLRGSLQR
jgi:cis-3-alkyl-4-acyloxetan-2-one decarboxylase